MQVIINWPGGEPATVFNCAGYHWKRLDNGQMFIEFKDDEDRVINWVPASSAYLNIEISYDD